MAFMCSSGTSIDHDPEYIIGNVNCDNESANSSIQHVIIAFSFLAEPFLFFFIFFIKIANFTTFSLLALVIHLPSLERDCDHLQ